MRPQALRLCVIAVAVVMLAYYVSIWLAVSPERERGTDFSTSYVAALLIREGHGSQIYDQSVEHSRHQAILLPNTTVDLPFITPPTTALLTLPLTLLGPGAAFRAFALIQLLLLGVACWLAAREAPWPQPRRDVEVAAGLAAMAGTATLPFLLLGQWDGVCALGVALAYRAWRRSSPAQAGFWLALGIGIAKPHLGIGLAAFLLARREWRAVGGAALATVALVTASVIGVGYDATLGFVSAASGALAHTPASSTLGILGFAASWIGDGSAARLVALAGGALAVSGAAWLGWRSRCPGGLEPCLAGAIALSLLAAPHLLAHDIVLLGPPLAWMCGWASARDGARGWPRRIGGLVLAAWLLVSALVSMDAGNSAPAPPGRVVPVGLLALGVSALLLSRQASDSRASEVTAALRH